jgi:hypothetical protein
MDNYVQKPTSDGAGENEFSLWRVLVVGYNARMLETGNRVYP